MLPRDSHRMYRGHLRISSVRFDSVLGVWVARVSVVGSIFVLHFFDVVLED